jgi:hypothetical protein
MLVRTVFGLLGAVLCLGATAPADAQGVYKCGERSYSQAPCSKRIVNTDEATVPRRSAKEVDRRRAEQSRLLAMSLRKLPDESAADFEKRRRWARMLPEDGAECARMDKRIPFEKARMQNTGDPDAVQDAQTALEQTSKRYRQMRC